MKSIEIIGYQRANLGKKSAKALRAEANVPCVLCGGGEQVHFYAPMFLFRNLVYTPEAHTVLLNIEGKTYHCILQDIQFHPVSEVILHADFLLLQDNKPVKMYVPLRVVGNSHGVQAGGKLVIKQKKLKIKALPKYLPDYVEVDITSLGLGKSIKVKDIVTQNFEILESPANPVLTIEVPRALKGKTAAS